MTAILTYIFGALMAVALLSWISQLFKVKVWLKTKSKREPGFVAIGFMDYKDRQEVPEVRLMGRSKGTAIGRIKLDENGEKADVEILITDGSDDSIKPQYRTCGYITQEGFIYKQIAKNKKPEKVGYTAKPSQPNIPSTVGERTWHSLWLKCTLNAYEGEPKESGKPKLPVAICQYTGIHNSKKDAISP